MLEDSLSTPERQPLDSWRYGRLENGGRVGKKCSDFPNYEDLVSYMLPSLGVHYKKEMLKLEKI